MALQEHDLAILTARFGAARFGASRFGFIPCPEDVKGAGTDEPGEYVWKEQTPASQIVDTAWTLQTEDCVCKTLCTLAIAAMTIDDSPVVEDVEFTLTVPLSGVKGLVSGIVRVHWGDSQHDQVEIAQLVDGNLTYTHTYLAAGSYTISVDITDERGCRAEATLAVTVVAAMTISAVGVQVEGGVAGEAHGQFTYTVTGGTAPYTYSLSWTGGGGGGPALDADPLVVFTGTPGTPETIPWTVVVNDDLGATANDSGNVNVLYNS